jgi:hypothetical protein
LAAGTLRVRKCAAAFGALVGLAEPETVAAAEDQKLSKQTQAALHNLGGNSTSAVGSTNCDNVLVVTE